MISQRTPPPWCKDRAARPLIGRMTMKLAAAALLALTSTASAQTIVATGPTDGYAQPPRPMSPRVVDGRVGLLLGGSDVGDADGFSMGAAGGLGFRIGAATLRGLF